MGEGVGGDCHANSARGEGKGMYTLNIPYIHNIHAYSRSTEIPSLPCMLARRMSSNYSSLTMAIKSM
jgi:hypothetical protein